MYLRTVDGRDLSKDEFRPIPSARRYQINRTGDLVGPRGKLLKESYNKTADTYAYNLRTNAGGNTSRTFQSLVDEAFPEDVAPRKPRPVKRIIRVGWTDMPGFPKHQMHESGEIRYRAGRRRVYPIVNQESGKKYYHLTNHLGQHMYSQEWLLDHTFPKTKEEEAA